MNRFSCLSRVNALGAFFGFMVSFCLFITSTHSQTTLWFEGWEGDPGLAWQVQGGTWQWGIPTSGPGSAHTGQKCAATVLGGNYTEPVDAYLIRRDSFAVPSSTLNPRLRFWHWYSFANGDTGWVEVRVAGSQSWQRLGGPYINTGCSAWTYPLLSLNQFATTNIYLRFYLKTRQIGPFGDVSSGWYVDDISVISGVLTPLSNEGWESGIGNWHVDRGTWEVGRPVSGPSAAYRGQNCAATVLAGGYCEPADSRLISAPFSVPADAQNPYLRFWHWFSFSNGDTGWVQVRPTGTTSWQTIGGPYVNASCGAWTSPRLSLNAFASATIELSFYFKSRQIGPFGDVSTGWYIDEVDLQTGPQVLRNPEGWEAGIGDWFVEAGVWEVGRPTSGPGAAYRGLNCAATVLSGNYCEPTLSRLISPWFQIGPPPRIRFWQWFDFANGDTGFVQFRTSTSPWRNLYNIQGSGGNVWSQPEYILTGFTDSTVQFAFLFKSRQIGPFGDVSSGWYVDSIRVDTIITNISVGPSSVPREFSLSQNYPNPFNPGTKIKFQIPTGSDVSLKVYDVLGREVKTLVSERLQPGSYETTFNGSGLASGVYLYRLQAGGVVETKKVVLLR